MGGPVSGIAPFVYCKSFHGALAQSLDVIQETGWGQNVRRPCNQSKKEPIGPKLEHKTLSQFWWSMSICLSLTYDDLAGLYCLGDLIGRTHFGETDSSYNKDDEA